MKIIVTGGAGFIGSAIVERLNARGLNSEIIIVDRVDHPDKIKNLNRLKFDDIIDYDLPVPIDVNEKDVTVFHQGACSDTLNHDGQYMFRMNHEKSKAWLRTCSINRCRMIYASSAAVYGDNLNKENPLNVYGLSKLVFDRYVQNRLATNRQVRQLVGLRYFNVYGPGENHKGRMASCAYQFTHQAMQEEQISLFEGSENFKRDFIHVDDVVNVNMFMFDNPNINGIFNCGTGTAESFHDLAQFVKNAISKSSTNFIRSRSEIGITTIAMPHDVKSRYQRYTCADISELRRVGYDKKFIDVATGTTNYVDQLLKTASWVSRLA